MISCIIVEDELPAREELKYFIDEEKEIKLIAEFDNPLDTLTFLEKNSVDAFEIKAYDYLLKPYSESRIRNLLKSLANIKNETVNTVKNNNLKKITINMDERLYVISLNDVDYIEADEKETLIFSNQKKYISKIKISKWEEMLKGNNFYRCHRSFIINLDKITEIEQGFHSSWIIKIKTYSTAIPVSRNNIKELKELFLG